jgi:hypothetical protein
MKNFKVGFAVLAILIVMASGFAAPTLPDNRTILGPIVFDSPFFPPDPSDCGDSNGFCFPPASPPAPDCAYTTTGCN